MCKILKKFTEGNARKFTVNFAFFGYADVKKISKNLRFHVSVRRLLQLATTARISMRRSELNNLLAAYDVWKK